MVCCGCMFTKSTTAYARVTFYVLLFSSTGAACMRVIIALIRFRNRRIFFATSSRALLLVNIYAL